MKKSILALSLSVSLLFGLGTSLFSSPAKALEVDGEDNPTPKNVKIEYLDKPIPFIKPAGSGEWDFIGEEKWTRKSSVVYSGGGDLYIEFKGGKNITGNYSLWEDDPNFDDVVSTNFNIPKPGMAVIFRDIGGWVDGDNKKAEFYLRMMSGPTGYVTTLWLD
ncbi:hypothetical protein AAGG74_15525 [Bacillus mexicanus]|uniref:hypothetical protein n=1 Tax=Bacillus mexicanus TaxID=2834415 RepID=UPI003D24301D